MSANPFDKVMGVVTYDRRKKLKAVQHICLCAEQLFTFSIFLKSLHRDYKID
ncbi:Uncharacterised protein [Staphylococcus condimenti]|nr:Uncharacterised protein [Staphylococcus condimenti]